MENITLTINGQTVITTKGKTILEVVHENKLDHIPTLCNDKRIEPYGSCYLCVVEIEGMNKLVPSCATPVNEGMKIHTNNERIRESRKSVIELLMSNHYADCIGPCINNCPAEVDAQGYLALISMGRPDEALQLIKQTNPLPLSIGRVCVRNCEDACRRCYVEDPVAINYLKRYVSDKDNNQWIPAKKPDQGKKVAIVGGGPAGLTCSYFLNLEGYSTTIFEKLPELGGMLKYGIPEYRLPKDILDSEIKWITDQGATVKTNVAMGKDFSIESLKKDGFDAVFLSVGAHKATAMGLEGEKNIDGVFKGIDFLRELEINGATGIKGTVVVVGGGNTAIDAARTALRCGADKVKIVYRRSLKEMPAHPAEIEAAEEEGVEINFLTNPKAIIAENGKLKGIECIRMKLESAGPGQRPKPVIIPDSEFNMDCDYLVSAIGQQVDLSFIEKDKELKLEKWGTITVNNDTFETSLSGVFAGGDDVNGPLTAVSAIGHGRKAANAIVDFLQNGKVTKKGKKFYSFKHRFGELPDSEFAQYEKVNREKMPEIPLAERHLNFKEVELGLTTEQVMTEAFRCLECGCSEYYDCEFRKYADEYEIDLTDYLGEVRKFKIDRRHPFIAFDPNKCINCGKCVRTCTEILVVSALGFVNRGFKSVVKTAMEKPLQETNCINCGNCIDVCPTGAIFEKLPHRVLGTLPKNNKQTVCNFCSLGCNVNFKVINDEVFFVSNSTEEIIDTINDGYLCAKGRFGYRYLTGNHKMPTASIKTDGKFKAVGIEEAVAHTSTKLNEIIKKYGADSVAVFASPKLTNEDLYLTQKLARAGIKTNNISSLTGLLFNKEEENLDELFGATVSTTTVDSIKNTDLIVLMNADLEEENLIMELKIKAAKRKGVKLITINSVETNLTKFSDLWVDTRKGTNTVLINGVINEIIAKSDSKNVELKKMVSEFNADSVCDFTGISKDKYLELVKMLDDSKQNIVFIYNLDSLKEKSRNDIKAISNFLSATDRITKEKNGLIIIREYSNSIGLQDMGVTPNYLPGYVKFNEKEAINSIGKQWNTNLNDIFKPSDILKKLLDRDIKAVLIFGEDPVSVADNIKYFNSVEFMLVCDSHTTETAKMADVIIPASSYIEQNGTYTTCDTKIQIAEPVIKNKYNLENWEIISKLAEKFGIKSKYNSAKDVFEEIKKVNRIYNSCQIDDYWNEKPFNRDFFKTQKKISYFNYRIDLTTFNPIKNSIHYSDNYFEDNINRKLKVITKING